MGELEFERTFLAGQLPPEMRSVMPKNIVDTYFPRNNWHSLLRLRKSGSKYLISRKTPIDENDVSAVIEDSITITKDEFESLMQAGGKRLEKDRYNVVVSGCPTEAEIDVFKADLTGLVLVQFKFRTSREKDNFIPPSFVLADVTQEEFIAGGMLAGKKYADIERDLREFGYKKL